MKAAAWFLLLLGFLWIVWDCVGGFTHLQHTLWIAESKQLPAGKSLGREQAALAMRSLALALNDYHRILLVPATMMLLGGVLLSVESSSKGAKP